MSLTGVLVRSEEQIFGMTSGVPPGFSFPASELEGMPIFGAKLVIAAQRIILDMHAVVLAVSLPPYISALRQQFRTCVPLLLLLPS